MKSTSGIYIVGLDHIRAIAAFLVFVWHFSHPPSGGSVPFGTIPDFFAFSIFSEGHTGVSLFMVLSGFLFSLLSSDKEIKLGQFYKNRFLRVFPLLFFWCIFGIAQQGFNGADVVRSLFTLTDIYIPANGWTIIIEAQFYLLFPFLHAAVERRIHENGVRSGIFYLLGFVGFMWFFRWCVYMQYGSVHALSYWTIFGRIDQFLMGAVFYYLYRAYISHWNQIAAWISFAASTLTMLVYYHWYNINGGWRYFGGDFEKSPSRIYIIFPTIEAALYGAIIASYLVISRNWTGKLSRAIAWIGTISYSIYLSNVFLIPLLNRLHKRIPFTQAMDIGENMAWSLLVAFPIVCIFSTLTYKFIEQPFLERRKPCVAKVTES